MRYESIWTTAKAGIEPTAPGIVNAASPGALPTELSCHDTLLRYRAKPTVK